MKYTKEELEAFRAQIVICSLLQEMSEELSLSVISIVTLAALKEYYPGHVSQGLTSLIYTIQALNKLSPDLSFKSLLREGSTALDDDALEGLN